MADTMLNSRILQFGTFELDLTAGELRKGGRKVRVQEQPFQLLVALVEKPGEVVAREELKDKLWPGDTYVDFDRSLNTAASKLRDALGDSASSPRFIETLPRRGYRFLGSVETVGTHPGSVGDSSRAASDVPVDGSELTASDLPPRERELVRRLRLAWFVAAVAATGALAVSLVHFRQTPPDIPQATLRKSAFTPPVPFATWQRNYVAISPNGQQIAMTTWDADGRLWIKDLGRQQPARAIDGGEGAFDPFWSPGSDFIGFHTVEELKKISIRGGAAVSVCQLPISNSFSGGSWSPDGESIVFSSGNPAVLYEVAARWGTPTPIASPEISENSSEGLARAIRQPHFLPSLPSEAGSRVLVYTVQSSEDTTMMVHDLDTGRQEPLGPGQGPFYSPSGHIVYERTGMPDELWALPFSLAALKVTGEAFPIAQNSRSPTIAADGTLVYADGARSERQLVWLDRGGEKTGEIGQVQDRASYAALSPDERRVAVSAVKGLSKPVWVWEIASRVENLVTSAPGIYQRPVWAPSGE
jgi:DNA-binding winged helix-turn-helix (wHTH) protein